MDLKVSLWHFDRQSKVPSILPVLNLLWGPLEKIRVRGMANFGESCSETDG